MRMLIKKLLKKYKYPPEGMEDAVQTVMTQCELWTDNLMVPDDVTARDAFAHAYTPEQIEQAIAIEAADSKDPAPEHSYTDASLAAEPSSRYGAGHLPKS
jgi:type I site-specific deoxyribonuclease, hsdR family